MGWIIGKTVIYILLGLIFTVFFISSLNLTKYRYNKDILSNDNKYDIDMIELVTYEDLAHLPVQVQNYLEYVGVIGKEKVINYRITFSGEMKMDEEKEFAPVKVQQTSYTDKVARLFYMEMKYVGLKITGYHRFENKQASMKIKVLDVFKVVDQTGEKMNQAETVTIFNDMSLLAPASLIDERITWEEIDDYTVRGTFTLGDVSVSANLYFNEKYQLINFISDDRYMGNDNSESVLVQWATPITEYREVNGFNLPYKGSAVWVFEDRSFEYIKIIIENVEYNK